MHRVLSLVALGALALPHVAFAAPQLVPIHGNLSDADGVPLDGNRTIVFRLYADASATEVVWSSQVPVNAVDGNFTVYLGEQTALDLELFAEYGALWLTAQISGDAEMTPIPLGSVPFAAQALDATMLDGVTKDELFEDILDEQRIRDLAAEAVPDTRDELRELLDGDYAYQAGEGLALSSDLVFSVVEAELRGLLDDDYALTAGDGITLSSTNVIAADRGTIEGWAEAVAFDTEAELTTLLDDNYLPASYEPDWSDLNNVPSGFADGTDDDTTYGVGTGLTLSSANNIGLDQAKIEDWAKAVAFDDVTELTDELDEIYLSAEGGEIDGDLDVTGTLNVQGAATFEADVEVDGDVTFNGDVTYEGSLQVGASTASCSSALMGTLRWDADMGLQVCDHSPTNTGGTNYRWVQATSTPPRWSGGCSSHGRSSGNYLRYCTNQTEHNTIADYLTLNSGGNSGLFAVKTAGYYRINWWGISNVCNWAHTRVLVNGTSRHVGHQHSFNTWVDQFVDVTWAMKEGDTFEVQVYSSGCSNYNYHSWNGNGAHSRLQVEWVGPLER